MAHPRYHRVPYVLGASLDTTAATGKYDEAAFRNDSEYPMEVYGLGFSLTNAVSSPPDQGYRDVGIAVSDTSRNITWAKQNQYPRVATLVDLVGNIHAGADGADLLAYNGTAWNFRTPAILPPEGKLSVELRNYISATGVNLSIAAKGALLVPAQSQKMIELADKYRHAVPYVGRLASAPIGRPRPFGQHYPFWTPVGDAARHAPNGTPVIAYERAPYLMTSSQSEASGIPTVFTESDFRNDSAYDVHVYSVGLSLAGAVAEFATQNMHDVNLRVIDVLRNQEWAKAAGINCATLIASNGSRMRIGQGTTWHSTKWDLGPGTILPPSGQLSAIMTNNATALGSMTLDVTFIGEQLIPILEGTEQAEFYRRHIDAVPSYV